MSGKGSAPRPFSVSREIYELRWAIAFEAMSQDERDRKKARLKELEWEEAKQEHKHLWGKEE